MKDYLGTVDADIFMPGRHAVNVLSPLKPLAGLPEKKKTKPRR